MEKVRLDKYLAKVLGVPRAQIAHLIDKKMVLVNGVVAKKSEIVGKGDDIKIAESSASNSPLGLHSADFANFGEQQTQSLVVSPKFAKNHESQTENPSVVDSALNAQNLVNLNPCEAPENSPASWCKKLGEASSSASADFLLEAEKRGSPPKSEKAELLGTHFKKVGGSGVGGAALLRKESSEISGVRVAESNTDSANSQNLPQIERIYEDDDILVLNKPPFLATHGAPSLKEPSLVEWLKAHKIQRSTISGELREGIVHRLDKQTSGALVVAKNNDAHNALGAQLADKTMGRLYLAIIDLPIKEDIEIECYLARNPKNRLKISKVDVRKYKKSAESRLDSAQNLPKFARYSKSKFYKLLPSKDGKKELILARLFTGRTHQIRAHLESINRHIVGDELYGYKRGRGENERVMLHAYLLELTHPNGVKFAESNNSVLGMQFRTCGNFRTSTDSSLVESPKISTNTKATPQFLEFASEAKQPSLPLRFCDSQNLGENQVKNAESSNKIQSKKPFKSFCSVWLSPKVESLLPLNPNLPNNVDSAISQNLVQNNSVRSTQTRPLRGAKNQIQASSSASADFLLEAEKRGSPPKSEKRQLLARRGSGVGGAALLREKNNNEIAESNAESNRDSSVASLPQNDNFSVRVAESSVDSANPKLRFIAPLFDDMKDYLAKNFDMEKVYEILHALPARTF